MVEKSAGQTLLESSYKLASPEDNSEYYDEFASHYDAEFADALDGIILLQSLRLIAIRPRQTTHRLLISDAEPDLLRGP